MIKLSFEDRLQIKEKNFDYFNVHHFDFSCGSFYVKKCSLGDSFMELFAKKVFDIVGIICANYYLLNDNFIISEDLKKLDNFLYITNLRGIKLRNVTLDMVRDSLTEIVCNKEDIKLQLNIMHFIDILFSNTDRHTKNYGISYCLYFSSLKDLTGQQAAILSYIDPLVAVVISVTVLGEGITVLQLIGGLLILGFTLWNEVGSSQE